MTDVCGTGNPDAPGEYACEYPVGHDRIWRYGAWQDHGAPSRKIWWVVPPFGEDDVVLITSVVERAAVSPYVEELLEAELAAHGWQLLRLRPRPGGPPTETELTVLTHGQHAAPLSHYTEGLQ